MCLGSLPWIFQTLRALDHINSIRYELLILKEFSCKSLETGNGQERLGTFEPERNNALERLVENGQHSLSRFKNERITVIKYLNLCQKIEWFI